MCGSSTCGHVDGHVATLMADDRSLQVGDLAEETRLPRELLVRFDEMWRERQRPFFSRVGDDGLLPLEGLQEIVRSLKISSALLCDSVSRVVADGAAAITFESFVRGYAKLHARTLKEALPFAFAVFDLDGDGRLGQDEFKRVISANLEMQELDAAALNRVLATAAGKDAAGVSYDAFRYFASLSSETILACCGFCLHCRDFYVPPVPLGTEAEEAEEEAAQRERLRVEREQEHGARGPAKVGEDDARGEAVGGGEASVGDGEYFADSDFLAALEQLKTTPEERAERCKAAGNEAMKHGKSGAAKAVESYTAGLDERPSDGALKGALFGNRAAAHVTLKNWGFALADATAALDTDALPLASALKASRRGAMAALQLRKLDPCDQMLKRAEALTGEAGAAGDAEAAELRKISESLTKLREEKARAAVEAAAAKEREAEVTRAVRARELIVRDFQDERLREQCVGARSGARIWFDAELDELHWPVLFLYPEEAQSDFIQDIGESEALMPHLVEMFGMQAENAPPWDGRRRYKAPGLHVYVAYTEDAKPGEAEREVVSRLRVDEPFLPQLQRLQPKGYAIPGVPVLHVLVGGSEYEERFFCNRLSS